VQDNDPGVHVQDLHTAGKLCQRFFPVGVAPNDQRRPQAFDGLPDDRRPAVATNRVVWPVVRDQNARPVPQK
jgi:hypothetical protein